MWSRDSRRVHPRGVAFTHYKARGHGKLPMCAICGGPGEGPRARMVLTHGVGVWLCAMHRDPAFLCRRAGRDFAGSLGAVWSGAGCLTARRNAALESHLRRVRGPRARDLPGSYAWPALRAEAEARFARGEPPPQVIAELRARDLGQWTPGPSLRTLRRWQQEGRWLKRPRPGGRPPDPPPGRPPPGGSSAARQTRSARPGSGACRPQPPPSGSSRETAGRGSVPVIARRRGSAMPAMAPARESAAATPIAGAKPSVNAAAEA